MRNPVFLSTFANNMKTRIISLCFLLWAVATIHAEVIVLRTGAEIRGTIVFQNDEVVVVKDASGARYQYPRTDIQSITENTKAADSASSVASENSVAIAAEPGKKVSMLLEVVGGGAAQPKESAGGSVGVGLSVGTHHLLGRRVFLGGGVAYRSLFLGGEHYAFLPLQFETQVPLLDGVHAPLVGASLGYGFALGKEYKGGLSAGVNIGYFYQINPKTALHVSFGVNFQQAKIQTQDSYIHEVTDAETGNTTSTTYSFANYTGRNLLDFGLRVGIFF